jgi:hypothetical protein
MSLIEINAIAAHVFNQLQKGKQRHAAWHFEHIARKSAPRKDTPQISSSGLVRQAYIEIAFVCQ